MPRAPRAQGDALRGSLLSRIRQLQMSRHGQDYSML
jgi:hypothetical protein